MAQGDVRDMREHERTQYNGSCIRDLTVQFSRTEVRGDGLRFWSVSCQIPPSEPSQKLKHVRLESRDCGV